MTSHSSHLTRSLVRGLAAVALVAMIASSASAAEPLGYERGRDDNFVASPAGLVGHVAGRIIELPYRWVFHPILEFIYTVDGPEMGMNSGMVMRSSDDPTAMRAQAVIDGANGRSGYSRMAAH